MFLVSNVVSGTMLTWSALTAWDFGPTISYIVPFVRQISIIQILLTMSQSILLRILTEYVWKRIPPMDNVFTSFFLTVNNLLLSVLLSIITCNSGSFSEVERLQGKSTYIRPTPVFNPKWVHDFWNQKDYLISVLIFQNSSKAFGNFLCPMCNISISEGIPNLQEITYNSTVKWICSE